MRDYIFYHNASEMGYDLEGINVNWDGDDDSDDDIFVDLDDGDGWEFFIGSKEFDAKSYEFSIVTSNKNEAFEAIGNRVWVIQGEAWTEPREYYLHGYFIPELVERRPVKIGSKTFKYRLYGNLDSIALPLENSFRLNGEFWFIFSRKEFQNFCKGFREIINSAHVADLEDCYERIKF